ncbi:dynein axonemal intermediate chain 3 [Marchantia polymorpha subsp. ruderalis]|uniref:Uncharacterized protein n=2 Tax=Marchantia polymorpha TaxID=3197 RepID=A0AAF6ANJ2_MARPO|nr:hypothetical protein MARPO_0014s0208 [Marchantia polymorpha]PTQ45714.1 hypothetical protein MARPO_0014s0208 [Marchantia polymorpha]BBM98012.1 hypothetical protein Mp_1g10180 [Marchantia polymorpha subsp. ruderalis]BBM98013.1 hypothetical protein Mp_1g10180 [Marchantia polymorpha subsp. ruderalis]|eukprot:PTQ45713.1 hypothetical protein MARPO_0014s0208 [Marchantia polymorpha]
MASIASEDASSPAEKPSAPPPPPPEAAAETQPPSPEAVADASATPTSVSDAAPAPSTDAAPAPAPAPAAAAAAETPVGEGGTPTMTRDLSLSALDIPIPSVSSIGKKKGPTPPPTPPPEIVKEPAKHPPGVFSLFLSSETALSIGLDKDDAKHESLHSVSAQKVFDDIKNRGAASEFRPLKGQLQNYWEPNFTFRYITDDRYLNNDNFEIYATYDSREKLLADIAEAIAIKEELEGPRVWKNLGSDIEVDRECVKASRPPIQMRASRRRDEFYQKFTLKDRDALETWSSSQMECRPFKDPSFDKFFAEQDVAISAISIVADKGSQTIQQRARNNLAQYEFRQFDPETKTKVMGSLDMGSFLKFSKPLYVDALQQNEVMDLYEDDFATFADEDYQLGDKTTTAITEYQSFSDITYGRSKMVSAVDWMPGRNGIVAAAISDSKSFDERMQIAGKPSDSYVLVWSFLDPIHPQMALESPSDVFSMRFNPVRPMLVAGGCYNGQVILWDLTTAQETVDRRHKRQLEDKSESSSKKTSEKAVLVLMSLLSSAKHSHSSIVSDIHWLPEDFQMSVKGQMVGNRGLTNFLASVSADGKVIFWDVTSKGEPELSPEWSDERRAAAMEGEKYKWNPVVEITLASLDPVKQVGPLKMAIHGLAAGGTQFYCSTEFGEILNADVTSPSGNNIKSIAVCHHGPVRALLASPFFKTVLLSIGIWTFALWKDNVKEPIFLSRCAEGYLTTGCWSPTRPAVIYIGLIDGTIEVWDLLDHSHQPSMIATVCSCQLTVMEFWRISSPQFLAVGDIQGILHILEIPRSLRRTSYKEKVAMGNFFARQQAWVVDVKNRSKERERQIEKAQAQKEILKGREEQFFKLCTWTEEMEADYQKYENECRTKFGAKAA